MSGDPAREIALLIAEASTDEYGFEVDTDNHATIVSVVMYGMASVQFVLSDGRTFLVDVDEGPLAEGTP